MKKTIILSGINLVNGGTFTIMKECLDSISASSISAQYKVIALVHKREIFPQYSNIELIDYPKSKNNYFLRFYYEYYQFKKVSKLYKPYLWLSLHDMSPIVDADIQAVYMHNPSPFLGRPKSFSFRGLGFSSLYKYIYRINIHSNKYLIVQQNWLRDSFSEMFHFSKDNIIVAQPASFTPIKSNNPCLFLKEGEKTFVYASYPRGFKNFEIICEASKILEKKGVKGYRVKLTIDGSENNYAKKLVDTFSSVRSIEFSGLQPRNKMHDFYSDSDCLIFPSKAETWGLPISEYKQYNKPMILADLPYAHETGAGALKVAFTNPNDAGELAERMSEVIKNDLSHFGIVPIVPLKAPQTKSWDELFNILLKE